MTAKAQSAADCVDANCRVRAGETALRIPRTRHTLYVVPTAADHADRWRGIKRGPPGDLEFVEIGTDRVTELASHDRTDRVDVIDTPAWPIVIDDDEQQTTK